MSCAHIIEIPCPVCQHIYQLPVYSEEDEQETVFGFEDAPIEVMVDLDIQHPIMCKKCKSIFKIELSFSASINLIEKGRFADANKN